MFKQQRHDDDLDVRLPKRPRHDASTSITPDTFTIAWICALPLEMTASRAMLDEEFYGHSIPDDNNVYVLGRIGPHNVVMVCLPGQTGTVAAATVAANLKRSFSNIRATLMVGIGGAAPGAAPDVADLRLGDVVVGTRVMQYDMGKELDEGFHGTADEKIPAQLLNSALSFIRSKHAPDATGDILTTCLQRQLPRLERPSQPDRLFKPDHRHPAGATTCEKCSLEGLEKRSQRLYEKPMVHYGVIASGNKVIKNAEMRDRISKLCGALCFEMEAAGVMDSFQCLPIRGICDYSDAHKHKLWQDYAAGVAAAYARELVLEALAPVAWHNSSSWSGVMATTGASVSTTEESYLERRRLLLESLKFSQIETRKLTIESAQGKTCQWLLRRSAYRDWLDPGKQSQHHGFLWMRGKAGAGKSTLMKFVYQKTKKQLMGRASSGGGTAVVSFFFNARGDYLEKSIAGMYRSLLLQLLHIFPDLQVVFDDPEIITPGQTDCPDLNALKELFKSAVLTLDRRSLVLFIDALDECDEQEIRDMVYFFEDLAEAATEENIQLRTCFSSRPYPYVRIRRGVLLALEEEQGHKDDLALYVKARLDPSLDDLQEQILDKAAGIFMWIVLVVDILNKERGCGALRLRKRLAEMPRKLGDLFKSILMRDTERVDILLLCILWVLCARRPLSPVEFRHALWASLLEQGHCDHEMPDLDENVAADLVTSSSKGLAEVTRSKEPVVQFIHESVRDFLVKEHGLRELWPEFGYQWEAQAHERLKGGCMAYLSLVKVRETLDGQSDFDSDEENDRDGAIIQHPFISYDCGDEVRHANAFMTYASKNVLHHANAAAVGVEQDDFVADFFATKGIPILNSTEKFAVRRYTYSAPPVYILADQGLENLLRAQLKRGPSNNATRERYGYPLFAALANGHRGAAAMLLDLPSMTTDCDDIFEGLKHRKDLTDVQGRTPLTWAAQEGRLIIVRTLVEAGADVSEMDGMGSAPLHRALQNAHETAAQYFIDRGADVHMPDKEGRTPLHIAVEHALHNITRLLLDRGVNTNARDEKGVSPLCLASEKGDENVAQLLLSRGADVNNIGVPLYTACQKGHEAVARLLIAHKTDVNMEGWHFDIALRAAAAGGHVELVKLLLAAGVTVDTEGGGIGSALEAAVAGGHDVIVEMLLEHSANVNTGNGSYFGTTLQVAAAGGHNTTVTLLLEKGADINALCGFYGCPLQAAAAEGHNQTVTLLLKKGADINAQGGYYGNSLQAAVVGGHETTITLLLEKGADANAQGGYYGNSLQAAAVGGRETIITLLLENGADVNAQGGRHICALEGARRFGRASIAELLKARGAR